MENTQEASEQEQPFVDCVLLTIKSMLSEVYNQETTLPEGLINLRRQQVSRRQELIDKKVERPDLEPGMFKQIMEAQKFNTIAPKLLPAVIRMDIMAIKILIRQIEQTLADINIAYAAGGLKDAVNYIQQGWSVGVITALDFTERGIPTMEHMFHLGLVNGRLVDISDSDDLKRIVERMLRETDGRLEQNMEKFRLKIRSWNLFLMKKL